MNDSPNPALRWLVGIAISIAIAFGVYWVGSDHPEEPGTYCTWTERGGKVVGSGSVLIIRSDGTKYRPGRSCDPGL